MQGGEGIQGGAVGVSLEEAQQGRKWAGLRGENLVSVASSPSQPLRDPAGWKGVTERSFCPLG